VRDSISIIITGDCLFLGSFLLYSLVALGLVLGDLFLLGLLLGGLFGRSLFLCSFIGGSLFLLKKRTISQQNNGEHS
jgi:uncharacterized SAM-binding protein YcdF (DUF218 family)